VCKPIHWIGSSKQDLLELPEAACRAMGFELWLVQQGDLPSDFKPMTIVGSGVAELRVRLPSGAYRVFFVAKFAKAIYVLHAFEKKTQKTSQQDIAIGQQRYKQMLQHRQNQGES
jgi:phage-related protein